MLLDVYKQENLVTGGGMFFDASVMGTVVQNNK